MSTTLASMESRVSVALYDSGGRVYPTTTIDEALRQALAEYNLRNITPVTLKDLDGAAATTLDPLHEGVIIIGASAFCARSRLLAHADTLPSAVLAALDSWSSKQMGLFTATLTQIFQSQQRQAANPPYDTTNTWNFPNSDGYSKDGYGNS